MDWKKIKNSFCVVPWIHLFIHNDGNLKLCCISYHSLIKDHTESENLSVTDLKNLDTVINSQCMKNIRQTMLKGEWHSACYKCRNIETHQTSSERTWLNIYFRDEIPQILADTKKDGTINNPRIVSLDMRVGNICNLKCRMCSPDNSQKLINDFETIFSEDIWYINDIQRYKEIKWEKDPVVWKNLAAYIPHLKFLSLAGGEPMINQNMFNFLKTCITSGYSKQIIVRYTTNLTYLPPGIEKLWQQFKKIWIIGSLDGYGELNGYIRYPAKWEDIEKNLKKLDQQYKEYNIDLIIINTTVQAYNIFYLDKLIKYLSKHFLFIFPIPRLTFLEEPNYLSCKILPAKLKKKASKILKRLKKKFRNKIPVEHQEYLNYFDYLSKLMDADDLSHLLPKFIKITRKWDKLRNQNLLKVAPRLKGLLNL